MGRLRSSTGMNPPSARVCSILLTAWNWRDKTCHWSSSKIGFSLASGCWPLGKSRRSSRNYRRLWVLASPRSKLFRAAAAGCDLFQRLLERAGHPRQGCAELLVVFFLVQRDLLVAEGLLESFGKDRPVLEHPRFG